MTHFTSYAITFISPKVNITAEYPEQIMNYWSVVIPLERAINGVPGMKYIASDGNDGKFHTSNI
jgi:HAE1 family hydrophobic/amphiphilic exporter-1